MFTKKYEKFISLFFNNEFRLHYNASVNECSHTHIMHNAREENLMKNKKTFTFLTTLLSAALLLGACNGTPASSNASSEQGESSSIIENSSSENNSSATSQESSEQGSSSEQASSSQQVGSAHTVTFVVDGVTVQTSPVEDGELAVYEGETPTKQGSGNIAYRFKGWDKDLTQPITADTVFTAVFEATEYASEIMVDDFESYTSPGRMKEAGWKAMAYDNATGKWTTNTSVSVSLGLKSVEGNQSLRFNSFENGVGYKFVKDIAKGEFTKSANALRFRLMVPSVNKVKVLLKGEVEIGGSKQAPSFSYEFQPESSEYVEYTLPLSDDNWILWDDATKTMHSVAGWMGVHEDDYLKFLTSIDFFIQGSDASYGGNGWPYVAFLDSVKFVTIDNPVVTKVEEMNSYNRYTGKLADGHTLRVDIGANGAATAKIIDLATPQEIPGNIAINDKEITFTSADNGASLKYVGRLTNAGQLIKFISATGTYANAVSDMNLNAVQVVDNYEQYETDGVSYNAGNNPATEEQRSGCRGAYYSEYFKGSGSSDWGGNGWSLMEGDGNQLSMRQDAAGAHTGNNYLCLKHSRTVAMRYMQWGLFDGTSERNSFRGSKFGFWARSEGWVKNFKFYMYSQNAPTNASKDEKVKSYQFVEDAEIGEWKHYEIELNPYLVYYGFMVLIEKNYDTSANQAYLLIDDVEVYTANPYAVAA